jgi:CubicO group peptidase (beta-lactamase class C family)
MRGAERASAWWRALVATGAVLAVQAGALVVGAANGVAQSPGVQVSNGFSRARLARMDSAFDRWIADGRIAGIVALVLRDGKPAYETARGLADREAQRRMTPDAMFRIASMSKAVTSAAILMLVEEGRVSIDDPVSRFIPAFARTTVADAGQIGAPVTRAKRQITVRDLLTHTSGISYGTEAVVAEKYRAAGLGPAAGLGWYTADKDEPICATMDRLATLPFVAQPGEAWVYGYNTDVLGCMVERASGKPLDEFIRTRITEPLGMKDTYFFVPPAKRQRLAVVYHADSAGRLVRAPEGPIGQGAYVDGPRRSFSGGAGLVSTARDYARFLEMTRNGGVLDGVRVLSPNAVALMHTNMIGTVYGTDGMGWGLGFETVDRFGAAGLRTQGSYGWAGAYGGWYSVDPKERLVLVMMVQVIPNTVRDLRAQFPTLVYQALVGTP